VFIDSIRSYKNGKNYLLLRDAIEILDLIKKYDIHIETSHIVGDDIHAVQLITVYKAK
jgi:hypothetical protein